MILIYWLIYFHLYNLINLRNLTKILLLKDSEEYSAKVINFENVNNTIFERFNFTYVGIVLTYLIGDVNTLINVLNTGIEINSNSQEKSIFYESPREKIYFSRYFLPILQYRVNGTVADKRLNFKHKGFDYSYVLRVTNELNKIRFEAQLDYEYAFPEGMTWTWLIKSIEVLKNNQIVN